MGAPSMVPTAVPTPIPTATPSATPTSVPTAVPTPVPTSVPTSVPTPVPTPVLRGYRDCSCFSALVIKQLERHCPSLVQHISVGCNPDLTTEKLQALVDEHDCRALR